MNILSKLNNRSLLWGVAVFLFTTLLWGVVLGLIDEDSGYLSILAGGIVGIVGGLVSGALFSMIQASEERKRLADVFEKVTRGQYKRVSIAEYPPGRPGEAKAMEAPVGCLISITHQTGTRMVHVVADYGKGRGIKEADLMFNHEPLRMATGRYRYLEGDCIGHQGAYELHLWDDGQTLLVKYSADVPHRGVDGYEIWVRC